MPPLVATTPVDVRLKSVLIATDFSEASENPLRYALAIARHYGAKFYLAHVVSGLGFTLAGPPAAAAATEVAWRDARRLEDELVRRGALVGLHHKVIICQGDVWEELKGVIGQEHVDLVVIGTHGHRGLGKLLLGSVAEKIFRQGDCPILTVGPSCPSSFQGAPFESTRPVRPFLFATDFGEASLHALPYAIALANHFMARLMLIHVLPTVPLPESTHRYAADDVMEMREDARISSIRRMEEVVLHSAEPAIKPEFLVKFGPASVQILQTAKKFDVDTIIMGLRRSAHAGTATHLPWTTAYEVVCGAGCPVLTLRNGNSEEAKTARR
jgi:nucleotide-binding universal stress UspA family protein